MPTRMSRPARPLPRPSRDVSGALAFVLKGYPRLSETFIAQEIQALEQRGVQIRLFSLRGPTDGAVHPVHGEIRAPVSYLPEYLHRQPLRVFAAWRTVRKYPGYRSAFAAWMRDLRRDRTRSRLRRFGQAVVLAHDLPHDVRWLHAHFLHTPASVTMYAALMVGFPWSVSAHAKDIWTLPEWEKREKLIRCRWLVTCTRFGADHLAALASEPSKVEMIYHGLDLARFPPPPPARCERDGRDPTDPVRLLSVGRAVEKKGYEVLLQALAMLPATLSWRLIHIGGGPRLGRLKQTAKAAGIAPRIDWMGARTQSEVLKQYRAADVFALAARIAGDGDRDGLPNVLMEAHSQGLACISTRVGGVPELIVGGETGLLVEPDDAHALAVGLERLIRDPELRARLGAAAITRVCTHFAFDAGIDRLVHRFGGKADHAKEARECALLSTLR